MIQSDILRQARFFVGVAAIAIANIGVFGSLGLFFKGGTGLAICVLVGALIINVVLLAAERKLERLQRWWMAWEAKEARRIQIMFTKGDGR